MTPVDSPIDTAVGPLRADPACTTCGGPLRRDANFCRGCGAAQTIDPLAEAPTAPLQPRRPEPPVGPPPARRVQATRSPREIERRRRRTRRGLAAVLVAVVAIAAAAAALLLIVLPGQRDRDHDAQLKQITAGAARAISSLDAAAKDSRPSDAGSLVALRAAATRTAENLSTARTKLRRLDREFGERGQRGAELKDAFAAATALARTLRRGDLSASTVAGLSARARRSASEVSGGDLPAVNTTALVAGLEARDRAAARERIRDLRARARRARQIAARRRTSQVSPSPSIEPSTDEAATPALDSHAGNGYRAQIPSGAGWGAPIDSEPTPGRLFRTTVRGPGGMVLLIDYTPAEPAQFGAAFISRREVGTTAFGSATEFIFQGGSVPECQRARCVDYIVNDGDAGFGVLVGGPDFTLAQRVGRSVMQSLTAE